jgi:hypothetical protein
MLDFPNSPSVGQTFTSGGATWTWDGTKWVAAGTTGASSIYLPLTGGTLTGPLTVSAPTSHIDNAIIGATTPAAASITSLNGGPLAGMRNRVINGDMRIDQRRAGASWTVPSGAAYGVDRWEFVLSQASKFTAVQGSAGVPGFNKWFGVTVVAAYTPVAGDYIFIQQVIEGLNIADFGFGAAGAQSVTLSFWVYTSVAGTHSGSLINGNSTRSYPFTFQVPTANTWTKIAVTIPGDVTGTWTTDNTAGVAVAFNLGSGSTFLGPPGVWAAGFNYAGATGSVSLITTLNAVFNFTGVQLEPGTVATPFERRLYGAELALCQRYYQTIAASARTYLAGAVSFASGLSWYPMRATPTAGVVTAGSRSNVAGLAQNMYTPNSGAISWAATAAGDTYVLNDLWSLSAEF